MKIKGFLFYFSVIFTGLIGGCEYRSVPIPPEEQVPSLKQYHVFRAEDMPLAVGNWWQYVTLNSGFTDTLTVTITRMDVTGETQNFYTHVYCHYNDIICDSGKFTISDTLLTYSDIATPEFSIFPEWYIRIPFTVKDGVKPMTYPNQWSGPLGYADTIFAYYYVPAYPALGKHYNAFSLKRIGRGVNFSMINTLTFTPDVGMINGFINLWDSSYFLIQEYKLYDYHVQNGKK